MKLPASDPGQTKDTEKQMNPGPIFGVAMKVVLMCIVITACLPVTGMAEELTSGTSSRKARQQALQTIPFQELNQQTKNKIQGILQKPSIYRRLPVTMINIDPDYFVFLARYPEVVVNIWKIMGVTKMSTQRTGPFSISTNDGVGTISNVELVYGTKNLHVFYGEGTYQGPVFKRKLRGECVLVLNTNYQTSAKGEPTATSQLDVFLKIENATAGMIAKTLNPIVGSTADHNFVESLNFLQRLNETTVNNGLGVQRMANRLTDINNDTRQKFIQMAGLVYERSGGQSPSQNISAPANHYQIPAYRNSNYQRPTNVSPGATSQVAPISSSFGQAQYHYGQNSAAAQQIPPSTIQTGYRQPNQYPSGTPVQHRFQSMPTPANYPPQNYGPNRSQLRPGSGVYTPQMTQMPTQNQPVQNRGIRMSRSYQAPEYPSQNSQLRR